MLGTDVASGMSMPECGVVKYNTYSFSSHLPVLHNNHNLPAGISDRLCIFELQDIFYGDPLPQMFMGVATSTVGGGV